MTDKEWASLLREVKNNKGYYKFVKSLYHFLFLFHDRSDIKLALNNLKSANSKEVINGWYLGYYKCLKHENRHH